MGDKKSSTIHAASRYRFTAHYKSSLANNFEVLFDVFYMKILFHIEYPILSILIYKNRNDIEVFSL